MLLWVLVQARELVLEPVQPLVRVLVQELVQLQEQLRRRNLRLR